jgi:hypothetical protein
LSESGIVEENINERTSIIIIGLVNLLILISEEDNAERKSAKTPNILLK